VSRYKATGPPAADGHDNPGRLSCAFFSLFSSFCALPPAGRRSITMSAQSRTASVRKKEHRFSTIALERVTKALGSFEDDACHANEADGEEKFPPVDRGKKALLFMCSAFAIEAIMWGTFYSF
jgi:hypothetical protein